MCQGRIGLSCQACCGDQKRGMLRHQLQLNVSLQVPFLATSGNNDVDRPFREGRGREEECGSLFTSHRSRCWEKRNKEKGLGKGPGPGPRDCFLGQGTW